MNEILNYVPNLENANASLSLLTINERTRTCHAVIAFNGLSFTVENSEAYSFMKDCPVYTELFNLAVKTVSLGVLTQYEYDFIVNSHATLPSPCVYSDGHLNIFDNGEIIYKEVLMLEANSNLPLADTLVRDEPTRNRFIKVFESLLSTDCTIYEYIINNYKSFIFNLDGQLIVYSNLKAVTNGEVSIYYVNDITQTNNVRYYINLNDITSINDSLIVANRAQVELND